MTPREAKTGRRAFIAQTCTSVAAAAVVPRFGSTGSISELPTVQLGSWRVTRLISGGNPIGGWAHTTSAVSRHMPEYFTTERTVDHIKPSGAVIVGMYPRFEDEITFNAGYTRKHAAVT